MNDTDYTSSIAQAEIAAANGQAETALHWYQRALEEKPDDFYALSHAGAVCASLRKYESMSLYFHKAAELNPDSGEIYFNLGNAYFYRADYKRAFEYYVEADRKGCDREISVRLYFQMAALFGVRGDTESQLVYLHKCEDADKNAVFTMTSDFLSEKLKALLALEHYEGAEQCAAQLVAVSRTSFQNYMVYFSVLMAAGKPRLAKETLSEAEKYADMTAEDRSTLVVQRVAVYIALAETDAKLKESYYQKALNTLNAAKAREDVTPEQRNEIRAVLAEVYIKMERYDSAIDCLEAVLHPVRNPEAPQIKPFTPPDPAQILDMMKADVLEMSEQVRSGKVAADLYKYAEIRYDEQGNPVHVYDDAVFEALSSEQGAGESPPTDAGETEIPSPAISPEFRDRLTYLMLSCVLAKDDFEEARRWAKILKHSANDYYSYFGLYSEALTERKIMSDPAAVERKYAETIAFFRNRSFSNPRDTLASVFRARLYAEEGSYEKAAEIARLLSEAERKTILDYMETCKAQQ